MQRQIGQVGNAQLAVSSYMNQVYLWMTFGLFLTGITAFGVASSPQAVNFIFSNQWVFWGLLIGQLLLVLALSAAVSKMSPTLASFLFLVYSFVTGLTFSSIFLVYHIGSIANVFFITAGTFLAMSVYGTVTKRDLTGVGNFLMMGLIGIIIASIVNFFLKSPMMDFVVSCIGVIIFTGLTAYDTQKLRKLAQEIDGDEDNMRRYVVLGALTLYLDFINLFLMLLRLLGKRD